MFIFASDTGAEVKNWNIFRDPPPEVDHRDAEGGKFIRNAVRVMKVMLCIFVFCIVLGSGVIAKGTILFMTSQLSKDTRFVACNDTCLHFCNSDGNICKFSFYLLNYNC
jgi:chitin synthase